MASVSVKKGWVLKDKSASDRVGQHFYKNTRILNRGSLWRKI
jgi:hypothetical protein